jgi:DeoR family ulaG and ulaABCDEF operon transcriptional repressor
MLEAERVRIISKLVQERSVVSVLDLVEILGASEATVRRDINGMAEAGVLRRIRGGVEALTPRHESHLVGTPFQLSQEIGVAQKRAIAQAAVGFIADGSSVIINGGTTTFAMVEFLVDRQIDILTNSVPILSALLATSRNRVSLPGGTVYREQSIVLSPYENDSIEHFWGQQLFTGCFGLNRFGLMEADPLIVQAETKLLKRAEQLVVLADSRKLRQRSSMIVAGIERISTLITDQGATEEELEPLRRANIRIIQVAVAAEGDSTSRSGVAQR